MKIVKVEAIPVTLPMKREMHMPGTAVSSGPATTMIEEKAFRKLDAVARHTARGGSARVAAL